MTGTWRAKLHADPAERSDHAGLVPGRGLRARAPRPQARAAGGRACRRRRRRPSRRPAAISTARPPPTSPSKATSSSSRRARTSTAIPGFQFGQADETIEPVRKPLDARPPPTRRATPRSPSRCRPSRRRPSRSKPTSSCACARRAGAPSSAASPSRSTCKQPRIGIKPLFKGTDLDEKQTASFEVVVLDDKGKRVAADGLNWLLIRLDTNWQWYRRDGQWNYEAVTLTRKVADGTLDRDGRRRAAEDRGQRRLRPLQARGHVAPTPAARRPASPSMPAGTRPQREPRARRSSTSRSTAPATSRATPPSCASPPSRAARRSSRCCRAACSPCRRSTSPTAAARPT